MTPGYELLDSGDGEKLERVGGVTLRRPAQQAVWPRDTTVDWRADHTFQRDASGYGRWSGKPPTDGWPATVDGLELGIRATRFGHLGLFAEAQQAWTMVARAVTHARDAGVEQPRVLNLFAYTGALSLAAARAGASVAHVDAAKGSVDWARDNAQRNGIDGVRWLVEDARKFVARELRRGKRYHAIALDPPTFGRGASKEEWKIERDLASLVADCAALLADDARLLLLTCHTPGITGSGMGNLLLSLRERGEIEGGELLLASHGGAKPLPSGSWCAWSA